jgi:hypothetical protein
MPGILPGFAQTPADLALNPSGSVDCRSPPHIQWRHVLLTDGGGRRNRSHRDVHILEDLAALNAAAAVGGFNEIVPGLTAMLAAERIDKGEWFGELLGFDQKAGAIDLPCCVLHFVHPWGRERRFSVVSCWFSVECVVVSCKVKEKMPAPVSNLSGRPDGVNSKFVVQ